MAVSSNITTKSKMNQKAYSVLFCALLASTFVHELRAKGVAPVSSRLGVLERAASNEICHVECSFEGQISFGLTIQVVGDVLVIINKSANVALIIDVSAQIIVLLNGSNGSGIAIDVVAKTGVYIKSGLWVAANVSIDVYIKSLSGGLKVILTLSGAVSFSLSSVSSEILKVINQLIIKLVAKIEVELEKDAKLGLQILLAVGGGLIELLNGTLKGLLGLIGVLTLVITWDIVGFLHVLKGFASVVVKLGGTLLALIELKIAFDLALIFGAANGLELFVNLILQIGTTIDIGAKLEAILNDTEALFLLLAQLGGNDSVGISGAFLVLANIVGLINGKVKVEVVISVLIQFIAESSQVIHGDLSAQLKATLSALLQALEQVNASGALNGLIITVKALIEKNLVISNVNISLILEKLLAGAIIGSAVLLEVLVIVVLQLEVIVATSILIPSLALVLVFKINSAYGIKQLVALGIQIDLNIISGAGSILAGLLVSAITLPFKILTGNFYDVILDLPGIGKVLGALDIAIKSASGGKISLKVVLNAAGNIRILILGFIQQATGLALAISSSAVAESKALYQATAGASVSFHIDISAGAAASVSG